MNNLIIEESIKTPGVSFAAETGVLELKGKSIPENSLEFYKPVFDWIENYGHAPNTNTEFLVKLEYFNTSSSKCLLDVFRRLETINLSGKTTVKVSWFYDGDDEDMMEAGEDYSALVKIPFELKKM